MSLLRIGLVVALAIVQPFNFSPILVSSLSMEKKPPLASQLKNQMILAPLTRGGNLPFRRLCGDFGMKVSVSEMVYARFLLQGDPIEKARMRRASNEECFGVQIATNDAAEGRAAMKMALEAGADFVDLNCGCPIHEATRRGLGSALLRSPTKLGNLVREMISLESDNSPVLPLSVKVRLGRDASSINAVDIVRAVRDAGAAAVTIHGRTAIQGYSKAADWSLIQSIVQDNPINAKHKTTINDNDNIDNSISIVGNGDIFTHFEAQNRLKETGVDAVMVGRGALIKPWIFQEFQQQKSWEPDPSERVAIYRRLACYMKDHFGDDEMGRKKSWNFLPWHFDFFARYIPLPDEEYLHMYATTAETDPLIQMRKKPSLSDQLSPLEVLLYDRNKQAHDRIASILWESDSDADALSKLNLFAESVEFTTIQNSSDDDASEETAELGNIRKERGKWHRRRRSNPKPQRTPEEIVIIRAERAAKKARLEMENNAANAGPR